jgi:hypothetical protein
MSMFLTWTMISWPGRRTYCPHVRSDGFDGFFSLEPHLCQTHALGGFSGPDLFTEAWQAFTDILKAEGITYF